MGSPPRSLLRLGVKNIPPSPPPARELPSTHPLLPRVLSSPSSHLQRPYSEYALQHVFSSSNAVRRWHHPCLLRHRRSPRARVARHRLLLAAAAAATTGLRCKVGRRRGGRGGGCGGNVLRRQVDPTLALPRRVPHAGRWMVRSYPADHDRDIRWLGIARVHRAGERRAYTPLRTRYTVHTTTIMHSPTTPLIHPTHTSHTTLTSANHWLVIPALHSNLRPPHLPFPPELRPHSCVLHLGCGRFLDILLPAQHTHTCPTERTASAGPEDPDPSRAPLGVPPRCGERKGEGR